MTSPPDRRIYHIATRTDWLEARRTGAYTTSTAGRTLDQEGFIHASRREQVQAVFERYYAKAGEPLVLLVIDPARLESEVRVEEVGDDTYPHVYGPITPAGVVDVLPLDKRGGTEAFLAIYSREIAVRVGLAIVAMLMAYGGAEIGDAVSDAEGAPLVGAVAGLALGLALMAVVLRRRA
ncbi:hypothetical protein CF8_1443 [Nocardioides sp. CF8]|uniref:DUF952 domain-containing protein n=1 Tax=Nocardioides sp. CF8 TaxID=110319 RepID=UPI000330C026|nr:DUF952 domain-containing protein [Nocardioides sp. CF8]EON24527.1 hypothetical protein CF8_1443 [Nocardioides sp. CF8]